MSNAYGSATIIFVIFHYIETGVYVPPNAFIALHKNFQNSKNDIMTLISVPNDKRNRNKKCCYFQYHNNTNNGHKSLDNFVYRHLNNAWYSKGNFLIGKPYLPIIASNVFKQQSTTTRVSLIGSVLFFWPLHHYVYPEMPITKVLTQKTRILYWAVLTPQSRWQFYHWRMLCTLDLYIVNAHWCRNGEEFLTLFTFWIYVVQ